jgi:uncharacterized membrane protein
MGASGPDRDQATTSAENEAESGHAARWADPVRAIAFSDAVFAIIITLLVLDLLPAEGPPGQLLSGLLGQWPTYVAYVASYLIVGVVWTNHNAVFHHIRRMDWALYWLNLAVLFGTGLLPFPTAVVARAMGTGNPADERTAVGLYALIATLATLSWLLFFHYLSRHPEVLKHDDDGAFFARERLRAVAGAVGYIGAGLLGVLYSPALALAIFVLLPIFYGLTSERLAGVPGWTGSRRGA